MKILITLMSLFFVFQARASAQYLNDASNRAIAAEKQVRIKTNELIHFAKQHPDESSPRLPYLLKKAEEAFFIYEDNSCQAVGYVEGLGGSALIMSYYDCRENLSRLKAQELTDLLTDFKHQAQ